MKLEGSAAEDLWRHAEWLRRFARGLVGEGDADDLVQETLATALRQAPADREYLRPWLATVLRNFARMRQRSALSRARREEGMVRPDAPPSPEDLMAWDQSRQRAMRSLHALAEPYRSTLLLRYVHELEPSEIAERMRLPPSTVRWRIKAGLALLRVDIDRVVD